MEVIIGIFAVIILLPLIVELIKELFQALLPFLVLVAYIGVLVLACYGCRALARRREAMARWYYFTFHPHPAEPAVRSALAGRRPLDGRRLAAALGETPPNNRILREVRIAQGERLVGEMRQASERLIQETSQNARSYHAQAALLGTQEAIALAAVALERAKAAHLASKSG
jgi:hypothetical protein